ncbi:MAG: type II toxin-antitoxin system RelE/ParE family toxin [Terriglobia bacterium]
MKDLEFHPDAAAELLAAEEWYAARSIVASRSFIQESTRGFHRLQEAPERWPMSEDGTRRVVYGRFPFSVIYRVRVGRVEVIAVAQQRRAPGYWKYRRAAAGTAGCAVVEGGTLLASRLGCRGATGQRPRRS